MLRRWQAALEYLSVLLLLSTPLALTYGATIDSLAGCGVFYLSIALATAVSLWLKPDTNTVPVLKGFAWLEQYLLLALLLTLLLMMYLPQAPYTSAISQLLWLQAQLAVLGLLMRLNWRCVPAKHSDTLAAPRWLVAYASQSGTALQLAQHSARQLQNAGIAVALTELDTLSNNTLLQYQKALFVVSTYGEGEPPDNANAFYQRAQHWQHSLQQLEYAVLALGDRSYQQFCAFGHWLNRWLSQHQARSLQPLQEVDSAQANSPALKQWQQLLHRVSGQQASTTPPAQPLAAAWQHASLHSRYIANPGSSALPCYVVKLQLPANSQWQAGDIVDIQPENSKCAVALWLTRHQLNGCQPVTYRGRTVPLCWALAELPLDTLQPPADTIPLASWLAAQPTLPKRSYSIASVPAEGPLMLLVRQVQHADGRLGIGSGWLTAWAMEQQPLQVQLRRHRQFHLPDTDIPLVFIASGTGIAGIRALLAQRVQRGQRRNWLLFGERQASTDFFFGRDLQQWQQQGFIAHCDLAFSRDGAEKHYVQHLLVQQQQRLQQWLQQGAAIYVCGSLHGMGAAVHQQLLQLLGDDALRTLQQQGRYRRDLY